MTHSHYGMIISSVPPRADLIAQGDEAFVRKHLAEWVEKHPLGEYEQPAILEEV